jgi:hypothetical protein
VPSSEGWKNLELGRKSAPERFRLQKLKLEAEENAVDKLLVDDPMAGVKVTWEKTTLAIDILMGKWLRQRGLPSRELLDALKEYRQQTKAVTEWVREEGLAADTDNFIADWVRAINGETADEHEGEEDPQMVLVHLHAKLTRGTNRLVDKWGRSREHPQRTLVEVMGELRQTSAAVAEFRRSLGATAQSERFFTTVASRLAEANLGEGVRPYYPAA